MCGTTFFQHYFSFYVLYHNDKTRTTQTSIAISKNHILDWPVKKFCRCSDPNTLFYESFRKTNYGDICKSLLTVKTSLIKTNVFNLIFIGGVENELKYNFWVLFLFSRLFKDDYKTHDILVLINQALGSSINDVTPILKIQLNSMYFYLILECHAKFNPTLTQVETELKKVNMIRILRCFPRYVKMTFLHVFSFML